MKNHSLRRLTLTFGLAVSALLFAPAAHAKDSESDTQAKALAAKIDELRKSKEPDTAALRNALNRIAELHNSLESKPPRHALQHAAGRVLSDKNLGSARVEAAVALGKLDDAKGAYKHLKPSLPTTKTDVASPPEIAAVKALGNLAPDSAISTLVEFMTRAKDLGAAKAATEALGGFASSKKRLVVLKELADYLRRLKPGYKQGKLVGGAARARWSALGRPLIGALNQLTGRSEGTADAWIELYKDHKRNPKELFPRDDS